MSPLPDILMLNNISTALKSTNIDTFCLIARLLFSSTIYHQYAKSDFFQLNSLQINKTVNSAVLSPPLGLDCVGAGYNRKVQSPPLVLDFVGAGYNRNVQSPPLWLNCVGARYNRKVQSPPLWLDCVGARYNRKVQSPPLWLDCMGAGYNR